MPKSKEAPTPERPRALPPLVGHAPLLDYFRHLGPDNLAQAYLLWGQRGVGKLTFAKMLAMTLHCQNPASFPIGFDGTCGACQRALAGSCGDTIVIGEEFIREADRLAGKSVERKTDVMGIETSRRIISLMQMHSYEGGRMVCIIPNFDFVTNDTVYNALLKELEEPKIGKLFLLTAERPDRVLPTVRSRATCLRFEPLIETEIAHALETQHGVPAQKAQLLARRAQGSLGDAIASLDDEETALFESSREWALACLSGPKRIFAQPALSKENARAEVVEVLRAARLAVRDALVVSLGNADEVLDPSFRGDYRKVAEALDGDAAQRLIGALEAINEGARLADETNIPPSIILGWLQVQLRSL